jgi:spore coat polysaccharide biosynthesis protein SpsF
MILAILQARTSSKRLPNKVLLDICGKPMIEWQIERIKSSKKIDKIVLATSSLKEDIPLIDIAKKNNIEFFSGDLENILKRFYDCSLNYISKHIVRLTGDCPLIDPQIIDQTIDFHLKNDFDYTSNSLEPTYPDGFDTEIFKSNLLKIAYQNAKLKYQKEHVTQYFINNPDLFKIGSFKNNVNFSFMRLTVDCEEDFRLTEIIYKKLLNKDKLFLFSDIINLFKKEPQLLKINSKYKRNEGLLKSIKEENYE